MSQVFHPERDYSNPKKVKAVEENGEEAEPVHNGADSVSEGEAIDANSGSTDSSGEGVTFPFKSGKFIPAFLCTSFLLPFTTTSEKCCLLVVEHWMEGRSSSQGNIYRVDSIRHKLVTSKSREFYVYGSDI